MRFRNGCVPPAPTKPARATRRRAVEFVERLAIAWRAVVRAGTAGKCMEARRDPAVRKANRAASRAMQRLLLGFLLKYFMRMSRAIGAATDAP